MKPQFPIRVIAALACILVIAGCMKDIDGTLDFNTSFNTQPYAYAGEDIFACDANKEPINLDGTASSDPDENIKSYKWSYFSGPTSYILSNADSAIAKLEQLVIGTYVFELVVTDADGLTSSDQVTIKVDRYIVREHDLDITFTCPYSYSDNYGGVQGGFYDFTYIDYSGTFELGTYTLTITESADSVDSKYDSYTYIQILFEGGYFKGNSSIKFKKLIQEKGGAIKGTFSLYKVECNNNNIPDELADLPPLTVTGNLDKNKREVTLRIVGQTIY
ncbi:PKD domain-containing protein [Flavihumibacter solisilvae]|uniref:PKD domain-containing protein n=1 Tax=Flavihumibacter solisilvae TaxID=1349421 RepID=A0A0C1IV66_9BACT|nr:PKD domain-containing protein [Flavihumibacter solisilvae]KIC94404.1 hypothetical protein OI18_12370 [Flavihumibacter solisilvae]